MTTPETTRPIKTKYYAGKELLRTNSSTDANRAIAQCVYHMQVNHYGSNVAEVYDDTSGQLHAQVTLSPNGNVKIVYQLDPRSFERKIAWSALFGNT
jgi:hypothetical protein